VGHIIEVADKITNEKNILFYFIGPGMDELCKANSNNRIHFTGYISQEDLISYYRSANIIILLSEREGIPVVLMEAMACGTVPVSTNVGGISELVEHRKTGFLIENNTDKVVLINKATEYILQLYSDQVLWTEISKKAYLFSINNFSQEKFNNSFQKLLII
jgi:glycosyltransferase involved in cell wall biosynthesis